MEDLTQTEKKIIVLCLKMQFKNLNFIKTGGNVESEAGKILEKLIEKFDA